MQYVLSWSSFTHGRWADNILRLVEEICPELFGHNILSDTYKSPLQKNLKSAIDAYLDIPRLSWQRVVLFFTPTRQ